MSRDPSTWTAPTWHADWGDPQPELEMLRRFAEELLAKLPDYEVFLDCFEEGYMCVQVTKNGAEIAEVHVVQGDPTSDKRSYGLFMLVESKEDELYFERPEEMVDELRRIVA